MTHLITRQLLTLLVAFAMIILFVINSKAYATDEAAGRNWANNNLENKNKRTSIPVWGITQAGRANSVRWTDHAPNPRFAVYDDLVLDKETRLIWLGRPFCDPKQWHNAIQFSRNFTGGDRMGWRLPTIEEYLSLFDPTKSKIALPDGHPFINVEQLQSSYFWTSTTYEDNSNLAYQVMLFEHRISIGRKRDQRACYWPVRGGNGYATGNW